MGLEEKIMNISSMDANISYLESVLEDIDIAIDTIDELFFYVGDSSNTYRGAAREIIEEYVTHLKEHVVNLKTCLEQGGSYMKICKEKAIELDEELTKYYDSISENES